MQMIQDWAASQAMNLRTFRERGQQARQRCLHILPALRHGLTPEEDAIGDPVETGDDSDETLPGDLWF